MEDHEIGEIWKAWILARLYTRRPRSQDLSIDDMSAETEVCPTEEPEEFFDDVIDWMRDEELLTVGQRAEGNAFGVRLTSRGIALMAKQEAGWTADAGEALVKAIKGLPAAIGKGGVAMAFAALRSHYGL